MVDDNKLGEPLSFADDPDTVAMNIWRSTFLMSLKDTGHVEASIQRADKAVAAFKKTFNVL